MKDYLIDTHCHINYIEGLSPVEIVNNAIENGVKKIVVPAANLDDFDIIIELCEKFDNV